MMSGEGKEGEEESWKKTDYALERCGKASCAALSPRSRTGIGDLGLGTWGLEGCVTPMARRGGEGPREARLGLPGGDTQDTACEP